MSEMSNDDINRAMRKRFWELDDQIKAAEAELAKFEAELDAIAAEEAKLRERRQKVKQGKSQVVASSNMVEMAKERSRIAVFLDRKTGTRDSH